MQFFYPFRLLALALAMLVPCRAIYAEQPPTKEIVVGIGLTKPPYIMAPGGTGLEYDIVEKALAARGYRMVAQRYPPARALALMRAGLLDAMSTVTEGIGGDGYFSENYVVYQNVAITLASRHIKLDSVSDLANYSVAAFQNAHYLLGPEFFEVTRNIRDYREFPQQLTQNKLLYSGRVDVVVGDRLIFRYLNREVDNAIDATQPVTIHRIFPPTPRKAVFREAAMRDEFNAGLKTIRENGTYAAILTRYREYLDR